MNSFLKKLFMLSMLFFSLSPALCSAQNNTEFALDANKVNTDFTDFEQHKLSNNVSLSTNSLDNNVFQIAGNTGSFIMVLLIMGIISFVAFIWALIDILGAGNESTWKILWVVVCFFLGLLGVLLYVFVGRNQKIAAPLKPKK